MKADDFRFPLPPGTHAVAPTIDSGGFDTVNGHLEVQFDQADFFAAEHYELWLKNKVSIGGNVTAQTVPTSLLIKFSYFGDR